MRLLRAGDYKLKAFGPKNMLEKNTINLKKDLVVSLIIGEVLSWLIFFLAQVVLPDNLVEQYSQFITFLPIYFPLLCAFCLYLAFLMNKVLGFIYQIAKFVLVGGLNTLMDWGVLAFLMYFFDKSLDVQEDDRIIKVFGLALTFYVLFKSISFVVATVNSYLWNKFWTFTRKTKETSTKEFMQFMIITILGFLINVGVATGIFANVEPIGSLNSEQWGMLAAVIATMFSMVWNFLGYKFIVFDEKKI